MLMRYSDFIFLNKPNGGSNPQPRDQELHPLLTESARNSVIFNISVRILRCPLMSMKDSNISILSFLCNSVFHCGRSEI